MTESGAGERGDEQIYVSGANVRDSGMGVQAPGDMPRSQIPSWHSPQLDRTRRAPALASNIATTAIIMELRREVSVGDPWKCCVLNGWRRRYHR